MVGTSLGHFQILEKIGEGGMGVVYRALDERLDRDVALKVLPHGILADEAARKRFRKEALALAKLNHPNIESVHDFDTQQGTDFLVMEFIPGETLSERLAAGPLPEKQIAELGSQLVEGLAAAHRHGVLHRDLKPGNLRVTPEGRLKILDFGLAKLVLPEVASASTQSIIESRGLTGTLPYVAPEQLKGDPADARTDIYQAGVTLYELATGRVPFQEKLPTAMVDSILHKPPPLPGRLRPDLSPQLEAVVLKCLEKDPESRYQSAQELRVDLKRLLAPAAIPVAEPPLAHSLWRIASLWAGTVILVLTAVLSAFNVGGIRDRLFGTERSQIRSLAVLPLENLSRDAQQEYFADGMTDELITQLSKINSLRVISRTSVLRYKGTKKSLPEIARELKVDAFVEGSVLRAGERIRITAQLVRAEPEEHLWANSYNGDLRDILSLHSEVARTVAREIRVQLSPTEHEALRGTRKVLPQAYEAFLRGRHFATSFRPEPLMKARTYLEQAIALDPNYAPAYAELAHVFIKTTPSGPAKATQAQTARALEVAKKAVALDPQLGPAHLMLAVTTVFTAWDFDTATEETRRAIELAPNDPDVLIHVSVFRASLGEKDLAMDAARRALELDPLNFEINWLASQTFINLREYDLALEQLRKTQELDPEFPRILWRMGAAYEGKKMYTEAVAGYQSSLAKSGNEEGSKLLGKFFAQHGARGILLWRKAQAERAAKAGREVPAQLAAAFAALGETDAAIRYLERAIEIRDSGLFFLRVNPAFDGMREDPRFQRILEKMSPQKAVTLP
jgi:serine/threonine-protein kinase